MADGRPGNMASRLGRRAARHVLISNKKTPKPKLRKPLRPWMRRNSVLKHIRGCCGVWAVLARRCGCGVGTIQSWVRKPGWEHVLEAFHQERLVAAGMLEERLLNIARYSLSDDSALKAIAMALPVLNQEYAAKRTVQVEGGKQPIQHEHKHAHVVTTADALHKTVEERELLLEEMETREAQLADDDDDR